MSFEDERLLSLGRGDALNDGTPFFLRAKSRRYQAGTVEEVNTKRGACWFIRFTNPDGKRPRYCIGFNSQYPTKAQSSLAANYIR